MSKLEEVREKAKIKLTLENFELMENYIDSMSLSGTKKASIWKEVLEGKIFPNIIDPVVPDDISNEELSKIDENIRLRGKDAILDILDKQMMIPDNLKSHLRKKYTKELVEAKEIIHKRKYFL
jgi:hypothetical protein